MVPFLRLFAINSPHYYLLGSIPITYQICLLLLLLHCCLTCFAATCCCWSFLLAKLTTIIYYFIYYYFFQGLLLRRTIPTYSDFLDVLNLPLRVHTSLFLLILLVVQFFLSYWLCSSFLLSSPLFSCLSVGSLVVLLPFLTKPLLSLHFPPSPTLAGIFS